MDDPALTRRDVHEPTAVSTAVDAIPVTVPLRGAQAPEFPADELRRPSAATTPVARSPGRPGTGRRPGRAGTGGHHPGRGHPPDARIVELVLHRREDATPGHGLDVTGTGRLLAG